MLKSLAFSFAVSLLSLLVVYFTPLDISIREHDVTHSPYREEIDALGAKEWLTPTEAAKHRELVEMNNLWFEKEQQAYIRNTASTPIKAWKKKNDRLSVLIAAIWGVLFFLFYRKRLDRTSLLALTIPLVLTVSKLISVLGFVLISFVVLMIWFWLYMVSSNKANV